MIRGAITDYIDVAQVVLYAFWIFFAGLLYYLHREDKREGYPLESDRSGGRVRIEGFPSMPKPKTFLLADGSSVQAPRMEKDLRPIRALPSGSFPGAPLIPTGNPMIDAVGPAAYAERANHPDYSVDGEPMIVPMRIAGNFSVSAEDPDPRGMPVYGADKKVAGTIVELWVDRAEPQIRYMEVKVGAAQRVLLPINFAKIDGGRRRVTVRSILASQFATVPGIASFDEITRREEDRILAYYSSGQLYATAARSEPLL